MPTLGIDFGTSTTRVAIRSEPGLPVALPIGRLAAEFIPSVAALRRGDDGTLHVVATGEDALNLSEDANTVILENLKRCLMYKIRPRDNALLPDWWDRSAKVVSALGSAVGAEEIIHAILEEALDRAVRASRLVGVEVNSVEIRGLPVAVGCPADAGYDIRAALTDICRNLGLANIGLSDVIDEPGLAAVAFAGLQELGPVSTEPQERRTVLVYDLGGGTFDVALVDLKPGQGPSRLTVLASASLPFVGGADIDEAFLDYLRPRLAAELGLLEDELLAALHPHEKRQLVRAVRTLKEELSFAENGTLVLPFLGGRDPLMIAVSRQEFEDALSASGVLARTLECAKWAYRQARMYLNREDDGGFFTWESGEMRSLAKEGLKEMNRHITNLILIGGSTRIPAIRREIGSLFPGKVVPDSIVDPITANALGAAIVRDGYTPLALDNCGFWIRIESGGESTVVHRPFDRYLRYVLGMMPEPKPAYKDDVPTQEGAPSKLKILQPDGSLHEERDFETSTDRVSFQFDDLGGISVSEGRHLLVEIESPPWQHESQLLVLQNRRARLAKIQEEEVRRAVEKVTEPYWKDAR